MIEKVIRIFFILLIGILIGFTWRSLQIDQSFSRDIGVLHEMQTEITLKIRELELVLEGIEDEGKHHMDSFLYLTGSIQF